MPRLVIRKGDGVGKDHALGGECVVGRQQGCTFILDDVLASRRHFRVLQEGSTWFAEDLGSTNGTLLNGRKLLQRQRLNDGDVLSAGNTELVFVQKDLLGVAAPTVPAAAPARVAAPPPTEAARPPAPPTAPLAAPPPPPSAPKPVAAPAAPSAAPKPAAAPSPAAAPPADKKFAAPVPRKRRGNS